MVTGRGKPIIDAAVHPVSCASELSSHACKELMLHNMGISQITSLLSSTIHSVVSQQIQPGNTPLPLPEGEYYAS